MNSRQEIKRLLEKHLKRELSLEETNELFDRLRTIHCPEALGTYFQSRWNIDRSIETGTDLSWEDIQEENQIRLEQKYASIYQTRQKRLWRWGVAASILLLVSLLWWNWDTGSEYVTYTTGFGETKNIVLDDGTSVVLNANSELIWKINWSQNKARFAQLRGEAYFKVAHIDLETGIATQSSHLADRMPFQVNTSDVVIDVLGTTFNVSDRRGETLIYLEEGSVKLGLLEEESPNNDDRIDSKQKQMVKNLKPIKTVLMEPGESIGYSAETQQLEKNNSDQSKALTEWKDGTLVYKDVLFGDMLDHMADIYGKEFEVQDSSLLSRNVNFGVPYENWETVMNLMEITLGLVIAEDSDNITKIKKRMK